MAVAPLIKPIQTQKGIFYSFQSAIEDLSLTFNNNTNKFRFSKFALLRIPEIGLPSTIDKDNKVQFLAQGETPIIKNLSANENINLANSFQNYALNFESLLISQDSYNREKKLNVSERVFWKWLKELGAVRWRDANTTEVVQTLPNTEARWAEDWYDITQSTYNKVVKYIGEIGSVHRGTERAESFRKYYLEYICKAAKTYGLAPFYWDNGNTGYGKECLGLLDHATGNYTNNGKDVLDIMAKAITNEDTDYTLDAVYNFAP